MSKIMSVLCCILGQALLIGTILFSQFGLHSKTGKIPNICSKEFDVNCSKNNPTNGHIYYENSGIYCVCEDLKFDITSKMVVLWIAFIFMIISALILMIPFFHNYLYKSRYDTPNSSKKISFDYYHGPFLDYS